VVRAEGLEPSWAFKPCGFSYRLRLSPPGRDALGALTPGLRSGLSLHPPPEVPELRCRPSSLYTFPAGVSPGLARDCQLRFPRAVLHRRFPRRALKFSLSPLRIPFRHARARQPIHDRARCTILHIRFLLTSVGLCGSFHVIFLYLVFLFSA
jgi:hypothetical protein